jgi:hypothetical protein
MLKLWNLNGFQNSYWTVHLKGGWKTEGLEFRVPEGSRIFSPPRLPDRLWGPMGTGGSFRAVKQPGREADNLTAICEPIA